MLFFFLSLIALAAANPAIVRPMRAGNIEQRIINGNTATSGQFAWQVSLQRGGSHFCGGSLVDEKYVLTAAHCEQPNRLVTVNIGALDYTQPEQRIGQGSFLAHPQHNVIPFDFDYAIITLDTSASLLSDNVATIELAAQDYEVAPGTVGTISGWGYTIGGVSSIPRQLQWTNIPFVSAEDCQETWANAVQITKQTQCVGGNGVSSCSGDSGGPLTVEVNGKTTLIGIASWAETNCNVNYPVGYAKVSAARDWFDQNMI